MSPRLLALAAATIALLVLARRARAEAPAEPGRRRLLEAAALLAALGAGGFLVAASGVVSTKASSGHWPPTEWFLRFALRRSVWTYSWLVPEPPPLDDESLVLKGAGHFETSCRSCHGAPDLPRPLAARHMLPPPPGLSRRAAERSPEELFHVVKHGIKMTGMPAWPARGRDDEIWAVVAFLRRLPALDEAGYKRLVRGEPERPVASQQVPAAAALAGSCARCHGARGAGRGDGAFPPLAGQPAEYLRGALRAYAAGERRSGVMQPVAAALAPEAIEALAAHYAALPPPPGRAPRDPAAAARGRELALRGRPERGVPACAGCHGLETKDTRGEFPALAGLPAPYLALQLRLLKEGSRGGSPYVHLMRSVARRLDEADIRDAAAFYEALASRRSSPSSSRVTPQAAGSR